MYNLHIGEVLQNSTLFPAFAHDQQMPGGYTAYNFQGIDDLYWFNRQGQWTQADRSLVIAHEFVHMIENKPDISRPLISGNTVDRLAFEAQMNGSSFDFDGPTVLATNVMAMEMGRTDLTRVSYDAVGSSTRFDSTRDGGTGYTDGRAIGVVRFGQDPTEAGRLGQDIINHEARRGSSPSGINDLMFGQDGNDVIKAGRGDDHVYGGVGNDIIDGGRGNDRLFGEDGNDLLDTGFYLFDSSAYKEVIDGGLGDDRLIVQNSNASVIGGAGDDEIFIVKNVSQEEFTLSDSDLGDRLYWNGYRLAGGPVMLIDLEIHGQPYDIDGETTVDLDVWYGWLDSNGVEYIWYNEPHFQTFYINTPDSTTIFIEDFQNGDFGINLVGDPYSLDVERVKYNPDTGILDYTAQAPVSNIVLDGILGNYTSLTGAFTAINVLGPEPVWTTVAL